MKKRINLTLVIDDSMENSFPSSLTSKDIMDLMNSSSNELTIEKEADDIEAEETDDSGKLLTANIETVITDTIKRILEETLPNKLHGVSIGKVEEIPNISFANLNVDEDDEEDEEEDLFAMFNSPNKPITPPPNEMEFSFNINDLIIE